MPFSNDMENNLKKKWISSHGKQHFGLSTQSSSDLIEDVKFESLYFSIGLVRISESLFVFPAIRLEYLLSDNHQR